MNHVGNVISVRWDQAVVLIIVEKFPVVIADLEEGHQQRKLPLVTSWRVVDTEVPELKLVILAWHDQYFRVEKNLSKISTHSRSNVIFDKTQQRPEACSFVLVEEVDELDVLGVDEHKCLSSSRELLD